MSCAYIALGANLNDRERSLNEALSNLAAHPAIDLRDCSEFYETRPVGGPPQPDFLNAVCVLETSLTARELLEELLAIEARAGRKRTIKDGPRVLDLDLLTFDDCLCCEPGLILPHPRMHERLFVLEPLAEIAPQWMHPLLGLTAVQLIEKKHAYPSKS